MELDQQSETYTLTSASLSLGSFFGNFKNLKSLTQYDWSQGVHRAEGGLWLSLKLASSSQGEGTVLRDSWNQRPLASCSLVLNVANDR